MQYPDYKYGNAPYEKVGHTLGITIICISVFAIVIVSAFVGAIYIRGRRRLSSRSSKTSPRWGYRDDPANVNLAPRRASMMESFARRSSFATPPDSKHSSRDPMATNIAPQGPSVDSDEEDHGLHAQESPQVYIGPPRDEDGHELHNVEIV
jgi:hypothetical protein